LKWATVVPGTRSCLNHFEFLLWCNQPASSR